MHKTQILSTCETGPTGLNAPEPIELNALYEIYSCSLSAITRLDVGSRVAVGYTTRPPLDTGITVFYDPGASFLGIVRIGKEDI